ncbi:5'-nucleotidase [Novosphingobium chloroacetimidivorans]|uniref:5'-nucleotidase n=1 Tax=Novosphingobium chloroacetimidivorans TaxID=1428314 RepID=A0A7W7KBD4_9SPHN|nr:bifunctional metallophosphatase/5'-nucleotidase [Novosphingobium chloroacetimidivorans]MBB4859366.1 5'-nucleotidase [Novosphingobium chloroacetimidivorans]
MNSLSKRSIPLLLASLLAACATPQAPHRTSASSSQSPVEIGIIAINDFHGALEPPKQSVNLANPDGTFTGVPAGGAAWLATAIDTIKAAHPNHVVVAAGDLTSASQLASSLYLDEPAVGVMNRIGLEFNAVGNHEFDRGSAELLRLQNGGCQKNTRHEPCRLEQFKGASYKYLSASTIKDDGQTLFPGTGLKTFDTPAGKITLGFIGLSLRTVPALVSPDALKGLRFADEADTINALVPKLKAQGADAVVVLIHQGGRTPDFNDVNGCKQFTGDIDPILDRLKPGVDVVVSGHTHWPYVCERAGPDPARPILLTSAGVYGELVTDITLRFDPKTHALVAKAARNVIVQSQPYTGSRGSISNTDRVARFAPKPEVASYVKRYVDDVVKETSRPAGHLSGPAIKTEGEGSWRGGPLGYLIADSQLGATRKLGAQLGFTNPFGVRTSLVPAKDGTVTFGQLYAVQPFNNELVVQTMTGAQILALIENGLDDQDTRQVIAPSANLRYSYDMRRPSGHRVVSLTLDGKPLVPTAKYRVASNSFLSEGGDFFVEFTQATDKVRAGIDVEAMEAWLTAVPMRQVPNDGRVTEIK